MTTKSARKEKLREMKKGVADAIAEERADTSKRPVVLSSAFTSGEPVEVAGPAEAPTTDNAGADFQGLDGNIVGAPYIGSHDSAHRGKTMTAVRMGNGDVIGVPESRLRSRIPSRRGRGRANSSNASIPQRLWELAFGKKK